MWLTSINNINFVEICLVTKGIEYIFYAFRYFKRGCICI